MMPPEPAEDATWKERLEWLAEAREWLRDNPPPPPKQFRRDCKRDDCFKTTMTPTNPYCPSHRER